MNIWDGYWIFNGKFTSVFYNQSLILEHNEFVFFIVDNLNTKQYVLFHLIFFPRKNSLYYFVYKFIVYLELIKPSYSTTFVCVYHVGTHLTKQRNDEMCS